MKDRKYKIRSRFCGEYCCRNNERLTWIGDTAGLTGLFGCTKEEMEFQYENSLLELIDPDYREEFRSELYRQTATGEDIELLFPYIYKDGSRAWILNRGQVCQDEEGQEYLTGVLVEITGMKERYDAERQMTSALREQAEQDSLTKIYNARTARKLAEEYMSEEEPADCVLFIIDLDNFKQVNDQYGHMFGDAVLVQAAQTIKKLFRGKDIVGRIGGEEFMVLMKDVTEEGIVHQRCRQLNEAFHEIMRDQMGGRALSCSIGASFAPTHGKTYFELFCCADQALYLAKDLGKDRYVMYDAVCTGERKGKRAHKFADYDAEVFRGYLDFE